MTLWDKPSSFLLSLNPKTLSSGTLARPNNGMLRVNLLEVGLSVGRDSKEGHFEVDVRWWAGGVGGNEGTKSSNEDGREKMLGMLWVDEMERPS